MVSFIVTFLVIFPLIFTLQMYLLFKKLSEPEKVLKPIGGLHNDLIQIISKHIQWLKSHNLERITGYEFSGVQVVVFQERDTQRFFCFMKSLIGTSFSITSRFDEKTMLETGTSGNT